MPTFTTTDSRSSAWMPWAPPMAPDTAAWFWLRDAAHYVDPVVVYVTRNQSSTLSVCFNPLDDLSVAWDTAEYAPCVCPKDPLPISHEFGTPPRLVCAAMLMDDGHVVTGARHFSPDMRATLGRLYGKGFRLFGRWLRKPYHLRIKSQGFIDAHGNFLDRYAAWARAEQTGQLLREVSVPGTLYSENLY